MSMRTTPAECKESRKVQFPIIGSNPIYAELCEVKNGVCLSLSRHNHTLTTFEEYEQNMTPRPNSPIFPDHSPGGTTSCGVWHRFNLGNPPQENLFACSQYLYVQCQSWMSRMAQVTSSDDIQICQWLVDKVHDSRRHLAVEKLENCSTGIGLDNLDLSRSNMMNRDPVQWHHMYPWYLVSFILPGHCESLFAGTRGWRWWRLLGQWISYSLSYVIPKNDFGRMIFQKMILPWVPYLYHIMRLIKGLDLPRTAAVLRVIPPATESVPRVHTIPDPSRHQSFWRRALPRSPP